MVFASNKPYQKYVKFHVKIIMEYFYLFKIWFYS
jgi:hypothetical protein